MSDRALLQQAFDAMSYGNTDEREAARLALRSRLAQPRKPMTVIYSPGQLAERGLTHEDVVKLIKENT